MSTGAERRSNDEGGELVLGRPRENEVPLSLKCEWFSVGTGELLSVVEELRWLGEGVKIRLFTTAEGEGGKRSDKPNWCSDDKEGI